MFFLRALLVNLPVANLHRPQHPRIVQQVAKSNLDICIIWIFGKSHLIWPFKVLKFGLLKEKWYYAMYIANVIKNFRFNDKIMDSN
jgi:hypothetical protein